MTNLQIDGIDFSPYALRGLTQSLEGIDSAVDARRTINATLRNVTAAGFSGKLKSTISCADQMPPVFSALTQEGSIVTVRCAAEVSMPGPLPSDLSTWDDGAWPAVPGSARWSNGVIFYRPMLTMMILKRSLELDEYGAVVSWSLGLEEV